MSGASESTAAMANREAFSMNSPLTLMNPAASQPQLEQHNFSPPPVTMVSVSPLSTQMDGQPPVNGSDSPTAKKGRGRPCGSRNKAKHRSEALGSTGVGFVPHILNVNTGEAAAAALAVSGDR